MVVEEKVKGFICTTAHPVGCKENVRRQIEYIKSLGENHAPKKVLVIGCSTGYGLASRIAAAFGGHADTLGVMYDKEASGKRTGTPGYYNTKAFEEFAKEEGLYAKSLNGDAFSREMKEQVIKTIQEDLGTVDLVIYSLAAPRRGMEDGTVYSSVLKTTGKSYTQKSLNLKDNTIVEATVEPATAEEIEATIKVMGGEDWSDWMEALSAAGVLSPKAVTVAYSYIGPEITYPIYYDGTIGAAKKDLHAYAAKINENLGTKGVQAYISVNKGLVTQASAAIPVVPLYFAMLYKVMKNKGIHEGCIEQMGRLFKDKLFGGTVQTDENGMIRMDDYEMREDVQEEIKRAWENVTTENVQEVADIEGYWEDFHHMFGFHIDGVDYSADVEV
jgi:enoyl-[acyl-carrier protein] reductase/trans-2-enoyl-CoA reductase (NAD+)